MNDWKSAESIADEALRITHHDRNAANGEPEDNFAYIALCWTALLEARGVMFDHSGALNAADVARMMVALKLCRDANAPHRDNRVDAVGYTLCLERVESTETVEVDPHTCGMCCFSGKSWDECHELDCRNTYAGAETTGHPDRWLPRTTPLTPHVENPEDEYSVTLQYSWCSTCKYLKGGPTCRTCFGRGATAPTHWEVGRTN